MGGDRNWHNDLMFFFLCPVPQAVPVRTSRSDGVFRSWTELQGKEERTKLDCGSNSSVDVR